MKIPFQKAKKAALKRKRAQEGLREGQQAAAPKRQAVQAPDRHEPTPEPASEPVDLTVDTSQEEVTPGAAVEPYVPAAAASPPRERDWGEGPSGVAPPSPEVPPAASPERAAPEPAEAPESGTRAVPRRTSLMDDGRRAERLLALTALPEFQEEIRQLGASSFFREIASALLRSVNFFVAAKELIYDEEAMILGARQEAEDATRRAETDKRRLEAALSQLARAEDAASAKELHITELTSVLQEAEGKARGAEERAKAADARVAELEAKAQEVEAAIEARTRESQAAAEARVAEVEARAAEAEAKTAGAVAKAAAAEARTVETMARAAGAEARLVETEGRLAGSEAKLAEAEAKAAEVEAKAAEAEAKLAEAEARIAEVGAKAVADFRASASFEDEVAEATAEAFLHGFRHGKERVARVCNLPQALEVEPSESDDEGHSAADP